MNVWYAVCSINEKRCTQCFAAWKAMGYRTAVLLDKGKPVPQNTDLHIEESVWPGYYQSFIKLCKTIGDAADIVVTGGDDITPDFKNRADKIGKEFFEHFPDGFGVMQPTGDDMPGRYEICPSPWIGSGWIRRAYGGKHPVWPEYFGFFGDEELKNVSEKLGVLWRRDDLIQYHDHWSRKDGPKKTDYQIKNDGYWKADETLFHARKAEGFPGHEPLIA